MFLSIYRNAILLGICQFLLMISASIGLSFNGLVGKQMASSAAWATLPFFTATATTALLTLLLPRLFARLGYQWSFALGVCCGVVGSAMAALGIWFDSFALFCAAGLLLGSYQATALYYRFAAADSVIEPVRKATAMAWVLNGGIVAAFVGPLLASHSVHWLSIDYVGSFLAVAVVAMLALPVVLAMNLPGRQQGPTPVAASVASALAAPHARAAILFCAGGYAMMMMVMLASPLAMHDHGYHAADAASVIQWHLLGMFAPSLLTGKLIARLGARTIAYTGTVILSGGCAVALLGNELHFFHWALLLVGIGWNFMYMGGSTLITQVAETPQRVRLQSLNEFVTFAVMTFTAATSGWLFQQLAWQGMLVLAVIFIATLVLVLMGEMLVKRRVAAQ